ncbi:MAG: alpha/beta hydrolase [Albidovulum sp.]|uniref:alpha/beta fold hydrolase n=1 Tax=Albidovulum sp. TaxID=1872424 RepID=UPI003C928C94
MAAPEMGADMQIDANGIRLEYEVHGPEDGPALILIRGLGSHLIHWPEELTAGFAAAGYRIVTFDNRDVGLSSRCPVPGAEGNAGTILADLNAGLVPKPAYHLSDMARDVVALMDALGIARAHVFGISMGGGIVQLLACDHGDRLLSAIMVMTSATLGGLNLGGRLVSKPCDRQTYIAGALEGDRAWGSPGFPASEAYLADQAARAFDRGAEAEGVNRQLLAILNAPDRRADTAALTLACLVIHGEDDTLIPVGHGRSLAALILGSELEVIDGMGHVITPMLAPRIVDRVDRFITSRL